MVLERKAADLYPQWPETEHFDDVPVYYLRAAMHMHGDNVAWEPVDELTAAIEQGVDYPLWN
jgi:hypothetical protein